MNKATTVIYLNDKRQPPQPLLNRVVFHIKQILRLLLNSVFNRKADEKKKFVIPQESQWISITV